MSDEVYVGKASGLLYVRTTNLFPWTDVECFISEETDGEFQVAVVDAGTMEDYFEYVGEL